MKLKRFFDDEFREYSIADCIRSIPSVIDGFKPSQRKCIYGMIYRGENAGEIKVAQLSGTVAGCIDKDMIMHFTDGTTKSIGEVAKMFDNNEVDELEVYSYNEETGETEVDICEYVWETKVVDSIIDIELTNGDVIYLTGDHIVYTSVGNKTVNDLVIGEVLVSYYSDTQTIVKITKRQYEKPQPVYDARIRKNHNFFIGKSKLLVHNCTDYHHGENSLNETIIGLAQDYTGSNNLNYFSPNGQFGSRLSSEASAPRYIFTEFTDAFRKIFKKEDDIILQYLDSDGQKIEPNFYIPLIPNILINGARGMGTGYATHILKYNPMDLRNNIIAILRRQTPEPILPWYRGFKGTITSEGDRIINTGCYEIINTTTIRITELPIGVYLDDYKKHLFKLQDSGVIKDFDNDSTEASFNFLISVPRTTTQLSHDEIIQKFKLVGRDTQNLTAWTETGHIKVFEDVQEIIEHFVEFRLGKYEERRKKLIEAFTNDLEWLTEKRRFIQFYLDHSKEIANKSKKDLEQLLLDNQFVNISKLLDIRIYNLTKDDIAKLESQIEKTTKDIELLNKTNCVKMYLKELEAFEV